MKECGDVLMDNVNIIMKSYVLNKIIEILNMDIVSKSRGESDEYNNCKY
jgi:hypothetical protein